MPRRGEEFVAQRQQRLGQHQAGIHDSAAEPAGVHGRSAGVDFEPGDEVAALAHGHGRRAVVVPLGVGHDYGPRPDPPGNSAQHGVEPGAAHLLGTLGDHEHLHREPAALPPRVQGAEVGEELPLVIAGAAGVEHARADHGREGVG